MDGGAIQVSFIEWACAMFKKDWDALFAEMEIDVQVNVIETDEQRAWG